MGGGLLQLVAYGAQDVYLTGNPQITFFKVVYRRHTNFALESIPQTFNGSVQYGQRVTSTISRNGDLISRVYLVITSQADKAVQYYGLRLIKYCEVEIGGQKIDKHYSEWMYIWNELSLPNSKKKGYFEMVGGGGGNMSTKTLHVPLEFWFCRNVGLALPLIGLQYHEVKINIQFEQEKYCEIDGTDMDAGKKTFGATLWVDYIYLDTDERRKFAQSSHEYLIEQLQFAGKENATIAKPKLNFNHPVKELIWTVHKQWKADENCEWFNYSHNPALITTTAKTYDEINSVIGPTSSALNPCKTAKLILNGNDRFSQRDGKYFNLIQPFQHHENIPNNVGINVYSFALKPEEHQPSGTLNMSRIDTATLDHVILDRATAGTGDAAATTAGKLPNGDYDLNIYAVNYNVLRILSGMGGIAYSN